MNTDMKRRMQVVLRQSFGLSKLKPGQQQAIETLLDHRDLLCILPTGGGKSLCYQLPAMLHEGCVLVVSPLIALMRGQVAHMQAQHVPAIQLDSQQTRQERAVYLNEIAQGKYRLVYVSPERLQSQPFQQVIQACSPWMVVVDEAHCVVQWGDSFRPAYQQINQWISTLPKRPVICAMTATADADMQHAIAESLMMVHPQSVVLPIKRDNLRYHAALSADPFRWIAGYAMQHVDQRGVVFCRSRHETESLARYLRRCGVACEHYHAGMERDDRTAVQQRFMQGEIRVLASTSAFGMGLDIPDIRFVIQTYLNESLIDYVQQSGRAGRDGQEAHCIQLIVPHDLAFLRGRLLPPHGMIKRVQTCLPRFRQWLQIRNVLRHFLRSSCLSADLSRAFGQHEASCGVCSACLRKKQHRPTSLCRVPPLNRCTQEELSIWCCFVARDRLANERHVPPQRIIGDQMLIECASRCIFPAHQLDDEAYARFAAVLNNLGRKVYRQAESI